MRLITISGARKQLFITFAPWVLVTVFNQPTQIIASLLLIGGLIGIFSNQSWAKLSTVFGERLVLTSEAVILIIICFGYGFAKSIFPENIAFLIVCGCYLIDQMIFSVGMARATYLKKIAREPDHVQSTLTAGCDHRSYFLHFSRHPGWALSGILTGSNTYFCSERCLATINIFVAGRVRVPNVEAATPI